MFTNAQYFLNVQSVLFIIIAIGNGTINGLLFGKDLTVMKSTPVQFAYKQLINSTKWYLLSFTVLQSESFMQIFIVLWLHAETNSNLKRLQLRFYNALSLARCTFLICNSAVLVYFILALQGSALMRTN